VPLIDNSPGSGAPQQYSSARQSLVCSTSPSRRRRSTLAARFDKLGSMSVTTTEAPSSAATTPTSPVPEPCSAAPNQGHEGHHEQQQDHAMMMTKTMTKR
jgi:hypothetical protein